MQVNVGSELFEGKCNIAEGQRGDSRNHRFVLQVSQFRQNGIDQQSERQEEHGYDIDTAIDVLELWLVRVEADEGKGPRVGLFAGAIAVERKEKSQFLFQNNFVTDYQALKVNFSLQLDERKLFCNARLA